MAALDHTAAANDSMPKEGLVRALFPAEMELRAVEDGMPTMVGHFAVFDQWTEINSAFEGNFLERIAPSAFDKTFSETTPKVLFNHGSDPQIGDKVLGSVTSLESDATGARYEVGLFDTSYNRDLVPGLQAGAYGASFRFSVMRQEIDREPKRTGYNPKGLPERTITEARVAEFGPVTFPAYQGATAGIRSLTDRFRVAEFAADAGHAGLAERLDAEDLNTLACMIQAGTQYISDQDESDDAANIPRMEAALQILADLVPVEAAETEPPEPTEPGEMMMNSASTATDVETRETITEPAVVVAAPPHPETRRGTQPNPTETKGTSMTIDEMLERRETLVRAVEELVAENSGNLLSADDQQRFDAYKTEIDDLAARVKAENERRAYVASIKETPAAVIDGADSTRFVNVTPRNKDRAPDNVFAIDEYHGRATSQEHLMRLYHDGARRALDEIEFVDPRADEGKAKENVNRALKRDSGRAELAQYLLRFGSDVYRRAFGKTLAGMPLTSEEQRALGIGGQGGAFPVPIQIDPTVNLVSNGVINPLRDIARNVTMTGYEWRGVSTTGVTATYAAEGAVSADGSPTLIQPTIDAERASVFVPYSWEVGQDWSGLEEELGGAIADSKDVLEATAFLTGAGHASNLPKGVLRSCATVQGTALNTNAGTVFTVQHVYELETALPPRFRPNATWVFNKAVAQRIRQFDTGGGGALWTAYPAPLQGAMPERLIGYPIRELSTMSTAVPSATGATWSLFGDFSKFIIADRIGMSITVIPQIFSGNTAGGMTYPTGQQGLYAFWRNSSDVISSNAFRGGTQS